MTHHRVIIWIVVFLMAGVVIWLLVWAVQGPDWPDWTGLDNKSAWDLAELLIIPIVLAGGAYWLNKQERENERKVAELRAQTEREIAADRERKDTLQAYLDKMTELMLEWKLRESQPDDEVRAVARARTLTALRELDGVRQGTLLRFLYEAGLINKNKRIIDLREADLSGVNLGGVVLLSGISLERVILKEANLERAILEGADLSMAKMSGANLSGAILKGAILKAANLSAANLQKAVLIEANMGAANLEGAEVTNEQLSITESLRETILPDGTKHE